VHALPDNDIHGCVITGAHLQVVRRPNANGTWAKCQHSRAVPMCFMVVRSLDVYLLEREEPGAAESDYLLVILFRVPLGAPMQPGHSMNYSSRYFAERSSSARSHHIKDAAPAPHEKTQQAGNLQARWVRASRYLLIFSWWPSCAPRPACELPRPFAPGPL
jgi:hypothetical protein